MTSITISRNMLNSEMKRFGKLSKDVVENLKSKGISVNIVFDARRNVYLSSMHSYQTIVFIAHGSASTIFHKYDHKYGLHQALIDSDTAAVLKGKKVIAFACGTAQQLALKAVASGCTAYLGFRTKIHMDKQDKTAWVSKKYRLFLRNCYKDAFAIALEEAIVNKWTFAKLKLRLQERMSYLVKERLEKLQKMNPRLYENHGFRHALVAVANVATNIMVHGDDQAIVA